MRKIINKFIAGTLACLLVSSVFTLSVGTGIASAEEKTTLQETKRIYGQDRYETGAKIVAEGWKDKAEYAVLAAGMNENLVDSLAAAPLAKLYNAPILLTEGKTLTPATRDELKRLETKTVFLTTGKGVIQDKVIDELSDLGISLVYLGGKDRFETSVNIALEMAKVKPFKEIVLTSAWTNADALSIAPIAAMKGMPILLTNAESLPPTVKSYIDTMDNKIECTYILGGGEMVSPAIEAAMPYAKRIFGINRYETNLKVLEEFSREFQGLNVFITNGGDNHLVDALAVSPLAALVGAPIVLTASNMSQATKKFIEKLESKNLTFLGSNQVITDSVVDSFKNNQAQTTPITPPVTPPAGGNTAPGGGGAAPGGSTNSIVLSDFKVLTNPAKSIPGVNNGGTIDVSQLNPDTMVIAISITASQSSTLQLTQVTDLAGNEFELRTNPPAVELLAGIPTLIQVSDVVGNLLNHPQGVSLSEFGFVFGKGAIFKGQITQNDEVKGSVTIVLKFKE